MAIPEGSQLVARGRLSIAKLTTGKGIRLKPHAGGMPACLRRGLSSWHALRGAGVVVENPGVGATLDPGLMDVTSPASVW